MCRPTVLGKKIQVQKATDNKALDKKGHGTNGPRDRKKKKKSKNLFFSSKKYIKYTIRFSSLATLYTTRFCQFSSF